VTKPTESSGLNLDINILIASTDRLSRDRGYLLFSPSPPAIEPEVSKLITAFKGR